MTDTVAAVVVTFNRKQLLTECLRALLRQSRPLATVFVIDNASTDGTETFLREQGFLDNAKIRYERLPSNMGGAGGFSHGVRSAFQAGFDWIWLMDDDTEPELEALERLEPFQAYPEVVAIANEKIDAQGEATEDGLRLLPQQNETSRSYPRVKFSSFVGILIRSSAVRMIGFPRSEFFIHSDDTDYCARLRKVGEIVLAQGSRVIHKEEARGSVDHTLFGYRYWQRSLYDYTFTYFTHRNYCIVHRMHAGKVTGHLLASRRFLLEAISILLYERDNIAARLRILLRAFWDGYRNRFTNDYPFRLRDRLKSMSSGPKA